MVPNQSCGPDPTIGNSICTDIISFCFRLICHPATARFWFANDLAQFQLCLTKLPAFGWNQHCFSPWAWCALVSMHFLSQKLKVVARFHGGKLFCFFRIDIETLMAWILAPEVTRRSIYPQGLLTSVSIFLLFRYPSQTLLQYWLVLQNSTFCSCYVVVATQWSWACVMVLRAFLFKACKDHKKAGQNNREMCTSSPYGFHLVTALAHGLCDQIQLLSHIPWLKFAFILSPLK